MSQDLAREREGHDYRPKAPGFPGVPQVVKASCSLCLVELDLLVQGVEVVRVVNEHTVSNLDGTEVKLTHDQRVEVHVSYETPHLCGRKMPSIEADWYVKP